MAGYKTNKTWSAPDIQFDAAGKRIRPEAPVPPSCPKRCTLCGGLGIVALGEGIRGIGMCPRCQPGRS